MKKVVIGMSGGVDSSVAAYLLKNEGYEVIGVTLLLNTDEEAIHDAKSICEILNIEHHVLDFRKKFKEYVIDDFIYQYKSGVTPNPCVICNKKIKFTLLWQEAIKLGADYLATGHYAAIKDNKLYKIESDKDQSYFLYSIDKDLLPKILFPLSNFPSKDEIRKIARENNLPVSNKKDSQDICFIMNNDYGSFLEKNLTKLPDKGNFLLKDGTIIGSHKGIIYYTIGQRKGLGISYKTPLYVIDIDTLKNEIILGSEEDLYKQTIIIDQVNLLIDELPKEATAKIRYKAQEEPCEIIKIADNRLKIVFPNKVKSPTKGQSLVLYDHDIVIGGGIITDTLQ